MSEERLSVDPTFFAKVYGSAEEAGLQPFPLSHFTEVEVEHKDRKVIAAKAYKSDYEGELEKEFILGGFEFEYHGGYQIDRLLKKVEDEAEELLNSAKARVSDIELEAREKGYNEGYEKGRSDGFKEVASLMESLGQTIRMLNDAREEFYSKAEKEMIDLVVLAAGSVIEMEVKTEPAIVRNIIRETLKDVKSAQSVSIKLNPNDLNLAKDLAEDLIREYENIKGVSFAEDPSIKQGGCYVETNIGRLDSTMENRLLTIYKDLRQRVYL